MLLKEREELVSIKLPMLLETQNSLKFTSFLWTPGENFFPIEFYMVEETCRILKTYQLKL